MIKYSMKILSKSKVYLIGAGPGDPGLISVRGLDCIKKADVIIYDYLVSGKLLSYAKPGSEIIYAGKRGGKPSPLQDKINRLLIKKAGSGKIVVRLKGGDPFVFGRGAEEALALAGNNIPFEIIPGITAGIAAPAYAGIPLTHRRFTSTATFITGHEDILKIRGSINWNKISGGAGTLIFYMGVKNLDKIVRKLIKYGRSPNEPAALIRWGTCPGQKTVVGTLKNIISEAKKESMSPPAVFIVGKVVKLREALNWFETKPLFGKRIIVTRSREQAGVLSGLLAEYGADAVELPTIKFRYPEKLNALDSALINIGKYDWLVFTSANGVGYFLKRLFYLGMDIRSLRNIRIATIGPATTRELNSYFINPDFQPSKFVAEAFVEEFLKKHKAGKLKMLLVHSDKARDYIEKGLRKAGASVKTVTGYLTEPAGAYPAAIREMLEKGELDLVTFTSSSTVKNFFKIYKGPVNFKTVSIGPITSFALKEEGHCPDIEATEYTIPGLTNAIIKYYSVADGK